MDKHNFLVIGMGEVLWDLLPQGKKLGGAPANQVFHAAQLGAKSLLISAIGQDELAEELVAELDEKGVAHALARVDKPTGTVAVRLREGIPDYEIREDVAWDHLRLTVEARMALASASAFCFGSLAQRSETSRKAIAEALGLLPAEALRFCDLNLRQNFHDREALLFCLTQANILKINEEELSHLAQELGLEGTLEQKLLTLSERFELKGLALTRGGAGSLLLRGGQISEMPARSVRVADTIGAGDSFSAALVVGWLSGLPLDELHERASALSAFVCTQQGAMPEHPRP